MVYAEFFNVLEEVVTPERIASFATVSVPVPSEAVDVIFNSPSWIVTAPVLVHTPDTTTLPEPILTNCVPLPTTLPPHLHDSSLPTFQTLLPEAPPELLKEQTPPKLPVPLSLPIVNDLPLFCTSIPLAISNVPNGKPLPLSNVKRVSLECTAGLMVPLNSDQLPWICVRVAFQPEPTTTGQ